MTEEINDVDSLYCKYYDDEDTWSCDITRKYLTLEGEKTDTINRKADDFTFNLNVIKQIHTSSLGYIDIETNFGTSCVLMKGEEGFSLLKCTLK